MSDLYLREARHEDMMLLFNWANDFSVRNNSFNSDIINLQEHKAWFYKTMSDINCKIFILTDGVVDYGQIKGEFKDNKVYIGYSIDSLYRGRGYGELIIRLFDKQYSDVILYAEVKEDNIASRKIFEKVGYTKITENNGSNNINRGGDHVIKYMLKV